MAQATFTGILNTQKHDPCQILASRRRNVGAEWINSRQDAKNAKESISLLAEAIDGGPGDSLLHERGSSMNGIA
jgi:hypothetical protein